MRIAALIVGIVAAASLLWIAGEQHYQSCVQAKRLGISYAAGGRSDLLNHALSNGPPSVKACSRTPF